MAKAANRQKMLKRVGDRHKPQQKMRKRLLIMPKKVEINYLII
jgi:hypothetical protein